MLKKSLALGGLVAGLTLLVGCSEAPDAEESLARQAMSAAEQAQAPTYAPLEWKLAQDTLQSAAKEKNAQNERFALLRKYGEAKRLFDLTTVLANDAKTKAEPAMNQARASAEAVLASAREKLDALTGRLLNIRGGKDSRADIEMMKRDAAGLDQALQDAQADFNNSKFNSAISKAESVIQRVDQL